MAFQQKSLAEGWRQLSYYAPMVQLSGLLGLSLITSIIYFGATVAPSGTAIAFTGTSTRMFTAMSRNKQMPRFFDKVSPKHGISQRSLLMNAALAILFLLLFRSWVRLAQVLSILHVISYLPIPIALCVLRKNFSPKKYPFRLPFGRLISLFLFVFFNVLFTMGSIHVVLNIIIIFTCMQAVFIGLNSRSIKQLLTAIKQCYILLLYFIGLLILTDISPSNYSAMTQLMYFPLILSFSILSFYILTHCERSDANIVTAGVKIYEE